MKSRRRDINGLGCIAERPHAYLDNAMNNRVVGSNALILGLDCSVIARSFTTNGRCTFESIDQPLQLLCVDIGVIQKLVNKLIGFFANLLLTAKIILLSLNKILLGLLHHSLISLNKHLVTLLGPAFCSHPVLNRRSGNTTLFGNGDLTHGSRNEKRLGLKILLIADNFVHAKNIGHVSEKSKHENNRKRLIDISRKSVYGIKTVTKQGGRK